MIIFLALAACVTTPRFERVKPKVGKGVVYTYQSGTLSGYTMNSYISVGDQEAPLSPNHYDFWQLKPGKYRVETRCRSNSKRNLCQDRLEITVKAGEETFVRFDADGGVNIGSEIKKGLKKLGREEVTASAKGYLHKVSFHVGLREIEGSHLQQ